MSSFKVPAPRNEPIRDYLPDSQETRSLKSCLKEMSGERVDIPCIIGGKEVRTGKTKKVVMPHRHQHVLAEFHIASPEHLDQAVQAALRAKEDWENLPWKDRVSVFLKAADLLAGPYRDLLNASTMLGQSKNVFQAEIDSACELIDFFRFNSSYYEDILSHQPFSPPGVWNRMEYRPLEGFIFAVTPFNFTSIAANLAAAPALVGNTVVWKPSDTQMLSAYYTMKLFKEAGLPDGVINLVGADGPQSGETLLPNRDLAGVHFTGSTKTFQTIYQSIGKNIPHYRSYPRIVGETGGKDFIFAHPSADSSALCTAMIRGAFEYQGQKCSAASRAYIPKSIWSELKQRLVSETKTVQVGDVQDFSCFMNAVIDRRAYTKITGYIERAKASQEASVICGGESSDQEGFFIQPTIVEANHPKYESMVQEIFGPVLTVYPYEDRQIDEMLKVCDQSTEYGLTGAIFANDRKAISSLEKVLRYSAGNFYINDKPTGAVVGQQPFGGARGSGTNDKAGSPLNLYRWISPRTIKETLIPPTEYRYPHMG